MFIIERFVGFALVVALCLSGCSESIEVDAGDDEGQIDIGQNDASRDAVTVQPSDATDDSAFDADIEASTNNRCRVVEPFDDTGDDAGMSEVDPDLQIVSGVISAEGECLAGVEVCLKYIHFMGTEGRGDTTNQYGVFEVPTNTNFRSIISSSGFELILRKAGYRFDPPSFSLTASDLDSNLNLGGLSTNVTRVAIPKHATGKWLVVETDNCGIPPEVPPELASTMTPEMLETLERICDSLGAKSGDILTFENACLFGGIGCVEGHRYTDDAICRSDVPSSLKTAVYTSIEGEYDEETQTWRITINRDSYVMPMPDSKNLLLERAP